MMDLLADSSNSSSINAISIAKSMCDGNNSALTLWKGNYESMEYKGITNVLIGAP